MCGIAGIIKKDTEPEILENISRAMAHRGPDAKGLYTQLDLALIHRRLSIIDLGQQADQPFYSKDGRYVLIYNGEIYNYKSIRGELVDYAFQTESDTEVLLAAYIEWGRDCLLLLQGMFAFALWDKEEEILFMGRDRLGIKPLYYVHSEDSFGFASELRALLETGLVPKKLNQQALRYYLAYHTVFAPLTLIENVYQFPPGNYAFFKDGKLDMQPYWQAGEQDVDNYKGRRADALVAGRELFFKAVDKRLMSDVPLAAFLSGGLDSSAVVAAMSMQSIQRVDSFSVGFEEEDYDESAYARMVAKQFNCRHEELTLRADDFLDLLSDSLKAVDTPGSDGLNVYVISRLIAQRGIKVALSGLGGDELFGGYAVFQQFQQVEKYTALWKSPLFLRQLMGGLIKKGLKDHRGARLDALLNLTDYDFLQIYATLGQYRTADQLKVAGFDGGSDAVASFLKTMGYKEDWSTMTKLNFAELYRYASSILLRDSDQMGMASGLEIRVPFMDHKLVDFVVGLDESVKRAYPNKKQFLLDAMQGILPQELLQRRKQGFNLPYEQWLRGALHTFASDTLKQLEQRALFLPGYVSGLWSAFQKGDRRVQWMDIWALVRLENWLQLQEF